MTSRKSGKISSSKIRLAVLGSGHYHGRVAVGLPARPMPVSLHAFALSYDQ